MAKNKSINLRFNEYDLERVKERARLSGLPYQTLITMVIHQYLNGMLWNKEEVVQFLELIPDVKKDK